MTTQQMLDERYGRTRSRRRRIAGWVVVGVIASALVIGLGWSTVSQTLDDVDVTGPAYDVADERTVTVTFQLTATPGSALPFALEPQVEKNGIVGWRIVEYPAASGLVRATTAPPHTLTNTPHDSVKHH